MKVLKQAIFSICGNVYVNSFRIYSLKVSSVVLIYEVLISIDFQISDFLLFKLQVNEVGSLWSQNSMPPWG